MQDEITDASNSIAADLSAERAQVLEAELYLDDHPKENLLDVGEEKEVVEREMLKTAIGRIENSARTQQDFENVVASWDKLEQNEARRLRNHEISRGEVPLEYGKTMDGAIFPAFFMEPRWKQLMSGNFLDIIHDCPFELHELVSDASISKMLKDLKDDHKEIFYWLFIRQLSCAEVGRIRGQSDRNIRKTRGVILRKLRKQVQKLLMGRQQAGYTLTLRQRDFLAQIEKAALDGGESG